MVRMRFGLSSIIVSLPLGFLGGVLGTLISGRDLANEKRFDAFLFQVHTGVRPE